MQIGSYVYMNNNYAVPKQNQGKVFQVRSEPYPVGGRMCVKLKDYSGCYAIAGLSECDAQGNPI